MDRRALLQLGLGLAAAGCTRRLAGTPGPAGCPDPTPEDILGTNYPSVRWPDEDTDLTRVAGRPGRAQGALMLVRGRVLAAGCTPLAGARVQLWQANRFGRYQHDDAPPGAGAGAADPTFDPAFQGAGDTLTDATGAYAFLTVRPGAYPLVPGGAELRAPHLHFRVTHLGHHEDIVQMYFAGDPGNATDHFLARMPADERARVIAAAGKVERRGDDEAAVHELDFVLRAVDRATVPPDLLARYAGRYACALPAPTLLDLAVDDDGVLTLAMPDRPRVQARPLGPGRLAVKAFDLELAFAGDPPALTVLPADGPPCPARRLP